MKKDMCSWKQILIMHFSENSGTSASEMTHGASFPMCYSSTADSSPRQGKVVSLDFSACLNNCNNSSSRSIVGFLGSTSDKELACPCRRGKRHGLDPRVGKIPWRRPWQPTPVFLPGESHGQRNLEVYSSWDRTELDRTEAT